MRTTKELFSLEGKTALVTGGSRGLGLQMALAMGEQGAKVVLSSRKQADLDEAVAYLAQHGVTAYAIAADLGKAEAVGPLVDAALDLLGGHIDILVNNAGATWGAPAEDHPLEAWDKVMNLNIRSIFLVSQAVGKRSMIPRKYGRIINIASIAGLAGNPPGMQTIAYNTSKAAVINFTRTLAAEWGVHGITVNAIAPGFFPSKMTAGLLATLGEEQMANEAPLRRLGDDEDLKGPVVLLASDAGKHITGQTLPVDGGVSAL
ncbi:SDR family oxidoreductase [Pseudoduganella sp. LjRoot289]|uniref:SDR family oxidoreductase n=1 Tax=Pseudoduganella sp. LjRoot289 TaxID=3342314 RepID=UPI003ECCA4A7